jgi:AcrR family transcriptional regulator
VPAPNRQAQRTQATKAKLLGIARTLFFEKGFDQVSAETLVQAAGLTRGALYHHFGGKEELFLVLYGQIQAEVGERIQAAALRATTPQQALKSGCRAFLEACTDPEVRQIMLIDGPKVLSWEQWRQIDAQYSLGLLKTGLAEALADSSDLSNSPEALEAIAHLLIGAMNEAALWIAQSSDPQLALQESVTALERLLTGLGMNELASKRAVRMPPKPGESLG